MTTQLESDAALMSRVRGGDMEAFAELYTRHVTSARRLAQVLSNNSNDVEDLVAEAFTRMLAGLRGGRGPELAFRAYLLTTVRNVRYDRARRDKRVESTDDIESYEKPEPAEADPTIAALERSYAARAFSKLPERWRTVLWHTEVEGESPAQIAPLLGLTANAVAALAYRARERLRQGYLAEHIRLTGSPRCHWTGEHLPGYIRSALARRERSKVDDHLAECAECRRLHRELTDANMSLRTVLAPILLGLAAPGYLAAAAAKTSVLAGIAGAFAAVGAAVKGAWWWLGTLPVRLARRYGGGNVAAASGVVAAALLGIVFFAVTVIVRPSGPKYQAQLPVPAPAQTASTAPAPAQISLAPEPPIPPTAPLVQPGSTGTRAAKPKPVPARPVALSPGPSGGDLVAGGTGTLPITVGREESAQAEPSGPWLLEVTLPTGIRLAGVDAGDGWRCGATTSGAVCARPRTPEGSTALIPVRVADTVTGFQTVSVAVDTAKRQFRVPVAPTGMRIGFSGTGPLGLALAGNTLLSCAKRPACLRTDNNRLQMAPLLPASGEPHAPYGLFVAGGPTTPDGQLAALAGAKAASGARLDLPEGATVRWAGLVVVASGRTAPDQVILHGPGGGWYPQRLTRHSVGTANAATLGYADVTGTLRGQPAGGWWLAALAAKLPHGRSAYAGWALNVVYELAGAPAAEIAVHLGPVGLEGSKPISVRVPSGSSTVGFAIFDGDRTLRGDSLWLGDHPIGEPANLATGVTASALALACAAIKTGCAWRTPGVDVGTLGGPLERAGAVTLRAGSDPIMLGFLAISSQLGTARSNPRPIR